MAPQHTTHFQGGTMPTKKANASKKKLAPGKKAQEVKPLMKFTQPVNKPTPW
jgi:hypothetical protein